MPSPLSSCCHVVIDDSFHTTSRQCEDGHCLSQQQQSRSSRVAAIDAGAVATVTAAVAVAAVAVAAVAVGAIVAVLFCRAQRFLKLKQMRAL